MRKEVREREWKGVRKERLRKRRKEEEGMRPYHLNMLVKTA